MLEFHHVDFQYAQAEAPIISDLSFQVEDKSFVSIIGPSGCGKSTIFRLLNGLEEIRGGEITLNGKNIRELRNYSSYMPQKDLLLPWLTVEQNVCLPMKVQKIAKSEQKSAAEKMLGLVGLSDYAKKYPRELSGGMRQRAAFARTLCAGPDLLLLDEPFSALDYITRISLQEWLMQQWLNLKKTILFITHDVEEALFLSQKIYVVTENPIHTLEICRVPSDYPRTRQMLSDPYIMNLKADLIQKLALKKDDATYESK